MSDIRHSLLRRDALSAAKEVLYHLDIYFSSQLQSGPLPLVDKGPAELLEEFLFQVPKERGAPPKVGPGRWPAQSEVPAGAGGGPGAGGGRPGTASGSGCRGRGSSGQGPWRRCRGRPRPWENRTGSLGLGLRLLETEAQGDRTGSLGCW